MDEMRNKAVITLNNVTFSDAGIYTCKTKNIIDSVSKSGFLFVKLRTKATIQTTVIPFIKSTKSLTKQPDSADSTGAIAGGIISVLIILISAVGISIFVYRRYGNRTANNPDHDLAVEYNNQNDNETAFGQETDIYEKPEEDYDELGLYQDPEVEIQNESFDEQDKSHDYYDKIDYGYNNAAQNQEVEDINQLSDAAMLSQPDGLEEVNESDLTAQNDGRNSTGAGYCGEDGYETLGYYPQVEDNKLVEQENTVTEYEEIKDS